MTEFVILIPLFATLMVLSSTFKFRRALNPVSIVVFWWCFWLWVANFRLTGFFIPGAKTQIMVLVMIGAIFLGSKLASAKSREAAEINRINDRILGNERYLFGFSILIAPVVGFFFFRALPLLLSGNLAAYRSMAFSGMDEPNSVFGGGYPQFLYQLIISPVIFFSLLVGLVLFFLKKKKRLLLLSLALISLEAVMMMGRFNFYYILAFVLLIALFLAQRRNASPDLPEAENHRSPAFRRPGKAKILVVAAALLAVLFILSLYRGEKNAGLFITLKKISIDYHTVGFVLFDQELSNPLSRLNTHLSFGRSSAGGLDTLIVIGLRRLNSRLVPLAGESGKHFDEQQVVGEDPEGRPIKANAFYTILYSLYFDGRYLMVILVPLLFGYVISFQYLNWLKNSGLDSLIWLILLMYLGLFSLFQSPVEGLKFWLALIFVLWLKKFSLSFIKVKDEPPA